MQASHGKMQASHGKTQAERLTSRVKHSGAASCGSWVWDVWDVWVYFSFHYYIYRVFNLLPLILHSTLFELTSHQFLTQHKARKT